MKLSGKLFILFFLVQISGSAQHHLHEAEMAHNALHFIKNKGQWDSKVLYRAPLGTGSVFLENNGFTYSQVSAEDIDHAHNHAGDADHDHEDLVHGHAWKANFIGSNASPKLIETGIRTEYHNYFIGNDPSNGLHVYHFLITFHTMNCIMELIWMFTALMEILNMILLSHLMPILQSSK